MQTKKTCEHLEEDADLKSTLMIPEAHSKLLSHQTALKITSQQ